MKTIYIRGGDKASAGVLAMKYHLEQRGHTVVRSKEQEYDAILCWGVSTRDLLRQKTPALNKHVNLFNKYTAMQRFRANGVRTPEIFPLRDGEKRLQTQALPWFARRVAHEKGKDIKVCNTKADVLQRMMLCDTDFFSVYQPHTEELRAWVFKDNVIAIYQKFYKNFGLDNYKNLEIRSELRDDLLRVGTLTGGAIDAVSVLDMDFGAVDILHGTDGKYYVLEVNSMPDISSFIRVSGVRLAKEVSQWAEAR